MYNERQLLNLYLDYAEKVLDELKSRHGATPPRQTRRLHQFENGNYTLGYKSEIDIWGLQEDIYKSTCVMASQAYPESMILEGLWLVPSMSRHDGTQVENPTFEVYGSSLLHQVIAPLYEAILEHDTLNISPVQIELAWHRYFDHFCRVIDNTPIVSWVAPLLHLATLQTSIILSNQLTIKPIDDNYRTKLLDWLAHSGMLNVISPMHCPKINNVIEYSSNYFVK